MTRKQKDDYRYHLRLVRRVRLGDTTIPVRWRPTFIYAHLEHCLVLRAAK